MSKLDPLAKPPRGYKNLYQKGKHKKDKRFPYVERKYSLKYVVSRIGGSKPYINPDRKRRREERNKKKNIEERVEDG